MSNEARRILTEYWGHHSFRPMQEEIIQSVLDGRDTLALLPTGGGKSVCYQVPGLMMEGMCLVITPLIALMNDQVEQLKRKNIIAKALHTGMHYSEIDAVINNAVSGRLKFLYVSPERLVNPHFQNALAEMKVNILAVDEAHCISQWGYDFRPPYLKIAEVREVLQGVPVLALTATATPDVVDDIQDKLKFKTKNVFKASFERKNISYGVYRESDKSGRMLQLIKNNPGTAIVYVRNRKKTRELAEILANNNISATFYHAGLNAVQREERQQKWTHNQIRVMVATNAFGMGIDKPDVRLVIHYNLPSDIESYFQEAGRAGRDGKDAKAVLLFNDHDIDYAKQNLEAAYPEIKFIKTVYNALGNYFQIPEGSGKDIGHDFKIGEFARQYNFPVLSTYSAIKFLEKEGYLVYDESSGRFSRLKIITDYETTYKFMLENPDMDKLLKEILRSYGGIFSDFVNINEKQISIRSGISVEKVFKQLNLLHKLKIVTYIPIKVQPQIFLSTERLPVTHIILSKENYHNLKTAAFKRFGALVDFLTYDKECRSLQLLRYFGEEKNRRCGICDVCEKINRTELSKAEFDSIKNKIIELLSEKPRHLFELVPMAAGFEEEKILTVIAWLIEHNTIIRRKDEKLMCQSQLSLDF